MSFSLVSTLVRGRLPLGLFILSAAFLTGSAVRDALGLIVPGNILGLFLLLAALAAGVVRPGWVENAAGLLLWLLPFLFLPVFVLAAEDRRFWVERGGLYAGVVLAGLLALWAFVGHLAQFLFRRAAEAPGLPGPLTDAEAGVRAGAGETPGRTRPRGLPTRGIVARELGGYLVAAAGCWGAAGGLGRLSGAGALVVWSGLTALVYAGARRVFRATRQPLLHPMFTALLATVVLVELAGRPYGSYRAATSWIGWLLGPAVVAMAVPVWRLRALLGARLGLIAGTVSGGALFGFASMALVLRALRQPAGIVAAGTLKSLTSPVALELARGAGAPLDAVAAGVLLAGVVGATVGPGLLRAIGVADRRARGLAMGCGSHGIGVARATEVDPVCGAFATLGMTGSAMLGAVLFPYLLRGML